MTASRGCVFVLALVIVSAASTVSAQLPLMRGSSTTTTFAGYLGSGFDPPPMTGRLDSDTWQPFGVGVPTTPFGGTCVTGVCARGQVTAVTAAPNGGGYYELPLSSWFGQALAMLSSDATLSPGGVHLRLVNAESVAALTHATVLVHWGRRVGLVSGTGALDNLAITADDCGLGGVSYPLVLGMDATSTSGSGVRYEVHDATFALDLRPAPLPPGGLACITFTIGGPALVRDILAIQQVTVTVPGVVCGDGFVDRPDEACEPTGATSGPCACDSTCQLPPPDTSCADGDTNPCTRGGCMGGHCMPMPIDAPDYVPACDRDGDPCTIEGCAAGMCDVLMDCPTPSSACRMCDPAALACDAPVVGAAGCCTSDADCVAGTCLVSACDTASGTCETPLPDPTCAGDGGLDAGSPNDASAGADGGDVQVDGGDTRSDASALDASTLDASAGPRVGFGGGGGCRCRAGAGSDARGAWLLLACLAIAIGQRRRRA